VQFLVIRLCRDTGPSLAGHIDSKPKYLIYNVLKMALITFF